MSTQLLFASALLLAPMGRPTALWQQEKESPTPAKEAAQSPAETLALLIERYNAARSEVFEAYSAAETDEARQEILAGLPGAEYIPEFRAVAEAAAGTDTAVKAWMWVLRLNDDEPKQSWEIIELLLSDHMESPALAELTGQLRYASYQHGEDRVVEALHAMVDESPFEPVRAGALFTLGAVLLESDVAERKAEGRDCFQAVITEYAELDYRGDSTYGTAAQGYLYELDNLQLGMAAPDFETTDENGVGWKLSDYRGKVVVVDFWGFW